MNSYTATLLVDQTPEEAFAAIANVRGWWSECIDGPTDELGAEFDYHYQDSHRCKMRIVEFTPNEKVVWLCLENYFDFIQDQAEWVGTKISFEISTEGDQTRVRFSHLGLVPDYECYDNCSNAWGYFINASLKDLITTGTGSPNKAETVHA
jgi:hypothetical protein